MNKQRLLKLAGILQEEISRDEVVRDLESVQTIVDGKRGVAFIAEIGTPAEDWKAIQSLIKDNHLKAMHVKGNEHNAFVVYAQGHEKDATELKDIAEKYGGYLAWNATKEDSRRIGELLSYKKDEIDDYIAQHYPDDLDEIVVKPTNSLSWEAFKKACEKELSKILEMDVKHDIVEPGDRGMRDEFMGEFENGYEVLDWYINTCKDYYDDDFEDMLDSWGYENVETLAKECIHLGGMEDANVVLEITGDHFYIVDSIEWEDEEEDDELDEIVVKPTQPKDYLTHGFKNEKDLKKIAPEIRIKWDMSDYEIATNPDYVEFKGVDQYGRYWVCWVDRDYDVEEGEKIDIQRATWLDKELKEIVVKPTQKPSGVFIDGKKVNTSSIQVDEIDPHDAPDYSDAYASYAEFEDGEELSDDQLDELNNNYYDVVYDAIWNSLHEIVVKPTERKDYIGQSFYDESEVPVEVDITWDYKSPSRVFKDENGTYQIYWGKDQYGRCWRAEGHEWTGDLLNIKREPESDDEDLNEIVVKSSKSPKFRVKDIVNIKGIHEKDRFRILEVYDSGYDCYVDFPMTRYLIGFNIYKSKKVDDAALQAPEIMNQYWYRVESFINDNGLRFNVPQEFLTRASDEAELELSEIVVKPHNPNTWESFKKLCAIRMAKFIDLEAEYEVWELGSRGTQDMVGESDGYGALEHYIQACIDEWTDVDEMVDYFNDFAGDVKNIQDLVHTVIDTAGFKNNLELQLSEDQGFELRPIEGSTLEEIVVKPSGKEEDFWNDIKDLPKDIKIDWDWEDADYDSDLDYDDKEVYFGTVRGVDQFKDMYEADWSSGNDDVPAEYGTIYNIRRVGNLEDEELEEIVVKPAEATTHWKFEKDLPENVKIVWNYDTMTVEEILDGQEAEGWIEGYDQNNNHYAGIWYGWVEKDDPNEVEGISYIGNINKLKGDSLEEIVVKPTKQPLRKGNLYIMDKNDLPKEDMTWNEAEAYVKKLGPGWRLPLAREIAFLADQQAIPENFEYYWTTELYKFKDGHTNPQAKLVMLASGSPHSMDRSKFLKDRSLTGGFTDSNTFRYKALPVKTYTPTKLEELLDMDEIVVKSTRNLGTVVIEIISSRGFTTIENDSEFVGGQKARQVALNKFQEFLDTAEDDYFNDLDSDEEVDQEELDNFKRSFNVTKYEEGFYCISTGEELYVLIIDPNSDAFDIALDALQAYEKSNRQSRDINSNEAFGKLNDYEYELSQKNTPYYEYDKINELP